VTGQILKHGNIVNLIETFKRKGRMCLVFEHVDHTILNDLDLNPDGLSEENCRRAVWQLLKAVDYLHSNNVPLNHLCRLFTEI
jgi:cyclin-dependent kinase-like